jgi:hypothetical protein
VRHTPVVCLLLFASLAPALASAEVIWIEGEKPVQSTMNRHPWWYDQVKRRAFSGGDFISNFNQDKVGEAEYEASAAKAGTYEFWVRANPVAATMSYRLNGGEWTAIDLANGAQGGENVAADGKPDLRFIAWFHVGKVKLQEGKNTLRFRMDSKNSNHGYIDCFVLANEPFKPQGILKPNEIAEATKRLEEENRGWFVFEPPADKDAAKGLDLRSLNEQFAGEGGFIKADGSRFVHSKTGKPVRFWAVNGPSESAKDRDSLARVAKTLARYGVNLVRAHGRVCDDNGEVDPARIKHLIDIVETMKAEGIYTHLSIYFPLWLAPKPGTPWLEGYDGKKNPFAALFFNKDFQAQYRKWWTALLTTPSPTTGKPLTADPALFGLEIINEDSYLFWTFSPEGIPDPQLRILEKMFCDWLKAKYGTLDKALEAWKGLGDKRDNLAAGRMGFRHLWNMFMEKTARDKDTTRFLVENLRTFYEETYAFLRGLKYRGMITASNWTTASPQVFGPLEKYTYTVTDFIDRHGYFDCNHKGDNAGWSIRDGHTYCDRSALRFEAEEPGKPKWFSHPIMDPSYNNKPSMISEIAFCRPNRYRSEAPLFFAAYGALQGSDVIVQFALDSQSWSVKPNFFMQPWTIMTPATFGQFPAAALIYRQGLVDEGRMMVDLNLKLDDLMDLKGTPLPQDASLDLLRLTDVPQGGEFKPGEAIDPLVHLVGRTNVNFTKEGGPNTIVDLHPYIDRKAQTVVSSTGQVKLDYGKGLLTINAPGAQGISGSLRDAGTAQLADVSIASDLPLGHIIAVSMDGQPLAKSSRILLQAMTEEKASKFQTAPAGKMQKRIVNIGQDPWMVKEVHGTVRLKRADAGSLRVFALDHAGYATRVVGNADTIRLEPTTLYYLIRP